MSEHIPFVDRMTAYTARAIERLRNGKPGESIDRETMAKIIERDCSSGSNGESNVNSAIQHVAKRHRIVWKWDRASSCWRCLDDSEKVTATEAYIVSARRKARRGLVVAKAVNTEQLSPEQAVDHRMQCTAMQAALLFTDQATRRKIESASKGHAQLPSPEKVAELFTT